MISTISGLCNIRGLSVYTFGVFIIAFGVFIIAWHVIRLYLEHFPIIKENNCKLPYKITSQEVKVQVIIRM